SKTAAGGDRDDPAPQFDAFGRGPERLFRVAGVGHGDEEVFRTGVRRKTVVPDDLDGHFATVRTASGEDTPRNRGPAHPDQEDALGLGDWRPGLALGPDRRRGNLVRKGRDDVSHPSRVDPCDGPRVEHPGRHGTRRNKDSVLRGGNQKVGSYNNLDIFRRAANGRGSPTGHPGAADWRGPPAL